MMASMYNVHHLGEFLWWRTTLEYHYAILLLMQGMDCTYLIQNTEALTCAVLYRREYNENEWWCNRARWRQVVGRKYPYKGEHTHGWSTVQKVVLITCIVDVGSMVNRPTAAVHPRPAQKLLAHLCGTHNKTTQNRVLSQKNHRKTSNTTSSNL